MKRKGKVVKKLELIDVSKKLNELAEKYVDLNSQAESAYWKALARRKASDWKKYCSIVDARDDVIDKIESLRIHKEQLIDPYAYGIVVH